MYRSNEEWTDVMQVCRNGHLINASYIKHPERNKNYCEKCGKETIIECPHCQKRIPGRTHSSSYFFRSTVSKYCRYCSEAYPWHKGIVKWKKRIMSNLPYIPKVAEWIIDRLLKLKGD